MSSKKATLKFSEDPDLELESSEGLNKDLIIINTTKRKDTIENIRRNLGLWMNNHNFEKFRSRKIDLAIILYLDKKRYNSQDLDNISKIVLDSLQKDIKNINTPYLIENDSQIVRLLLYKLPRTELKNINSNSLVISFRLHDPKKDMLLINKNTI